MKPLKECVQPVIGRPKSVLALYPRPCSHTSVFTSTASVGVALYG